MRAVVALADVELLFWDAAHECHASDLKDAGAARSAEVKAAVLTDLAQGGGCDRADWSDTDIAALVFTGGATGLPKGVMLTQAVMRAIARSYEAEMGYGPGAVFLHSMPLFHVAGIGQLLGGIGGAPCRERGGQYV